MEARPLGFANFAKRKAVREEDCGGLNTVQYAKDKSVSSEQSQAEVQKTLIRYGALKCAYIEEKERAAIMFIFQQALSLFGVVVEGAFVWLVYGFTRAFSSGMERLISLAGMGFLVVVMLINLVTHFMMVKGVELHPFQLEWIDWGAVTVFIAVLLIVLFITLADPVIRLIRLELRYMGKQQEKILEAKTEGLECDKVQAAMAERADFEAERLADQIIAGANGLQTRPTHASSIGYVHAQQTQTPKYRNEAEDPKK